MNRINRCIATAAAACLGTLILGYGGRAFAGSFYRMPSGLCQVNDQPNVSTSRGWLQGWYYPGYDSQFGSMDGQGITVDCSFIDTPDFSHGQTTSINVETDIGTGGEIRALTCVTFFGGGGGACGSTTQSQVVGHQTLHPDLSGWTASTYPYDMAFLVVLVAGSASAPTTFSGWFASY